MTEDSQTKMAPPGSLDQVVRLLLNDGAKLSNIAFNAKQRDDVPADIREHLARAQRDWDHSVIRYHLWLKTQQPNAKLSDRPL